jgi:hypothetical protein
MEPTNFDGDLSPELALIDRLQSGNTSHAIVKRSNSAKISHRLRAIRERIAGGQVSDDDIEFLSMKFLSRDVFFADILNVLDSIVNNPEVNTKHRLTAIKYQLEFAKQHFPAIDSIANRMSADDINANLKRIESDIK